jgi:hypothetical protein
VKRTLKRARLEARLIVSEAQAEATQHRILAMREAFADTERLRNEIHARARAVLEDARTSAEWILSTARELAEAERRAATVEATLTAQRAQTAPNLVVKQVRRDAAVPQVQSTIDAEAVLAWRRDAELFAEYDEQAMRGAAVDVATTGAEGHASAHAAAQRSSDVVTDPAGDGGIWRRAASIADLETVPFDSAVGDGDGADVSFVYAPPVEDDEFYDVAPVQDVQFWDSPLAGMPVRSRRGRRLFLGLLAVAVGFGLTVGGMAVAQGHDAGQHSVLSRDPATTRPSR